MPLACAARTVILCPVGPAAPGFSCCPCVIIVAVPASLARAQWTSASYLFLIALQATSSLPLLYFYVRHHFKNPIELPAQLSAHHHSSPGQVLQPSFKQASALLKAFALPAKLSGCDLTRHFTLRRSLDSDSVIQNAYCFFFFNFMLIIFKTF